jgi:AraC-like DNA-binding protein
MRLLDNGGWGSAATVLFDVPPDIADLAEHTWIDDWREHATLPRRYRIVPDTAPHLIANITRTDHGDRLTAMLIGARTRFIDVDASRRLLTVGIRLRPGTLASLGIRHATLLTDTSLALDEASSRPIGGLGQLAFASDTRGIADELQAHLRAMYRRPIDARARHLVDTPLGRTAIAGSLCNALGFSDRGARAWARRTMGMSIRDFQSIRRLHAALLKQRARPGLTWGRIAALSGYSDQSHLIRDCRALLGETPVRFIARADSFKT